MAKVADLIEQNQKKLKTTQQLAGEAGLPLAPITAVGTGTLGGTPQQQAMAGTPAQKKSVLESVAKTARPGGETQLEQAQTLRAPAAETTQDIAAKSKVQQLVQSTGTFGAKVSELVDRALTAMTAPAQPTAATPTTTTPTATTTAPITLETVLDTIPETNRATVDDLLKRVAAASDTTSPSRNELLAQLNAAMGKTPGQPLDAEAVAKLYASATETVVKQTGEKFRAAAMGTDAKLTLSDFEALGTSVDEVASLLGITPEEAGNLSVTDFQNKLAGLDVGTKEVQATTAGMAGTSLLSTAERQALRGVLTQLEERGLAGADVQYASLLKDIDAGTQVSVGGTKYGIDELLADGAFSKIAEQYFANPNDPWAKQLAEAEPELVQYLTNNRDTLQRLINETKTATTAFGGLQTSRAKLFEGLSPELVKSLTGTDLSQFATSAVDINSLPAAVQELSKLPAGQRTTYANNLTALSDVMGPDYVKGLKPETLAAMKLTDANGPGAQWLTTVKNTKASLNSRNPEEVLDAITDGTMDLDDVDAQLSEDTLRQVFGFPASGLSALDTTKDGKISSEEVQAAGQAASAQLPSFEDFSTGKWKGVTKIGSAPQLSAQQQIILDAGRDGTISPEEVKGLSIDQMSDFLPKMKADSPQRNSLSTLVDSAANKEIEPALAGVSNALSWTAPTATGLDSAAINYGLYTERINSINALMDRISQTIPNVSKLGKNKLNDWLGKLAAKRDSFAAERDAKYPRQSQAAPASPPPVSGRTAYRPEVTKETFEGY